VFGSGYEKEDTDTGDANRSRVSAERLIAHVFAIPVVFEPILKAFVQRLRNPFISEERNISDNMDAKGGEKRRMSNEEIAYIERVYQNQHMMVGNAINAAIGELQDLNSANKAIEEMGKVAGSESFTSIGGDFYLKSKINKESKVIIGVGGGFLVEKELEQAQQTVKRRIDAKNDIINKLAKNRKELEAALVNIQEGIPPQIGSE
jgi:prefoldin alpha subunit